MLSGIPLVSIIIPTYNRSHLIAATLQSVQAQTHQNWECIVVDDASTDRTAEVVENLQDARIKFIPLSEKGNANIARNKGVSVAKGDYIAFLDSDDKYLPNHLERGLQILQSDLADVVLGSAVVFWKDSTTERITRRPRENENPINFLLSDGYASTCGLILNKAFAKKLKWNETLRSHQDYDYFEQMVKAGGKIEANTAPSFEIFWDKQKNIAFGDCIMFMEPRSADIDIKYYLDYLIDKYYSVIEFGGDNKFKKYYKKEIEKRAEYISYRYFSSLQKNNKGLFNFYNRFRYGWLILIPEFFKKMRVISKNNK